MYITLDISDWKLKVFEKRKLESLRYFRIWKPELGYYRIFITALLLNWFWTPSFLSVLHNCRLILPPTLFQVLLTFLKLFRLLFFHSWCFLPLLKLWKPRSIENGAAAISESLESAFVSMQRCTKRFIAQRKTDSFPAKRSEKRETPFPDNLLGRKTEFPKFRHYRQFYRTSCEERIKWSQNSIKRLDCKKKIGLFWKEQGNMSPLDPCYYMAQPITGEIGDGGRGKCVLGKHVIRSSDPSICFQLCSKNKKR